MAQGTNDREDENKSSSDEAALSARLGSLEHRLSEVRGSRNIRTDQSEAESGDRNARASAMAMGFRLSTSPFGLIVFVLVGFSAGVLNVIRSAGVAPDKTGR
jgi:ATP synthase protein I